MEIRDYQEKYENIRKSIDKKEGQNSNLPSQLQLNLTINQKIQNGILLNNLSSIYLSQKKFEKALYLSTSSSYDFESFVFEQGDIADTDDLKKDQEFKQRVIILLNSYLNMGRAQENIGRLIKDVQDYSTKFLFFEQAIASYVNGCRLSKKYLGLEDQTFFCVFQELLSNLRKEKEENYVKSFQSPHYIPYGQGYLDQTLEKRLLDFIDINKKQQNDQMILTENNQYEQSQILTDRPKKFLISKPKKQYEFGQSASFKEFKNSWFLSSNVPNKASNTQRNIISSPSVQKSGLQNSFNSSQQLFQNVQKGNSFINQKKQSQNNQNEQFMSNQNSKGTNNIQSATSQYTNQNDSHLNHQNSNQISSLRNININNQNITQVTSQHNIQLNNQNTQLITNQNNSVFSNQDEFLNFQTSTNILNGTSNNYNSTIASKTYNQRQYSVPNIKESNRSSKPPINGSQAQSSGNYFHLNWYSSLQSGQPLVDQSIQSPGVGIPLHLIQNQSNSISPPMNQISTMNQNNSQPVSQPFENYFQTSSYSPIHLQSAPSFQSGNTFSYNVLPTLPSVHSQQYSITQQYFPQTQDHISYLQHQYQANMQQLQGMQFQQQQFMNQNYYPEGNLPVFPAQKSGIDPKLFDKNQMLDNQSDKTEDDNLQQISANQISIKNMTPVQRNESKKSNQISDRSISNKALDNSQIKKEKDSIEIKNQKKKESEEIIKYNELHNMISQQNEKITKLQEQLEKQKTNENIQYESQSQEFRSQKVHNQVAQNDKPSSLRNIQDNQERKVKNTYQSGSQTNPNNANNNNNNNNNNKESTLTSFDTSPIAANGQKRGSKTDIKVHVSNEFGSQVVINAPKEYNTPQPQNSTQNSSQSQAKAISPQDQNNNKKQNKQYNISQFLQF